MDVRKVVTVALLGCAAAGSALAASGPDELWEVTVKVEMTGMPFALPAQTVEVCVPKGQMEGTGQMDENCTTYDVKKSGNKTSYRFKCTGDMTMSGQGESTMAGNSYKGSMQAKGHDDGASFEMKQSYSGKRIGNCTYEDPGKQIADLQARQKGDLDRICDPREANLEWRMYEANNVCADYRDAFCKHVKNVAKDMRDPAHFAETAGGNEGWHEALSHCGVDPKPLQADACKRANKTKNWQFVADFCEADAKALAAKHCAGRTYTSAMESEYAPICVTYAQDNVAKGERKAAAPTETDASDGGQGMQLLKEGVKEGLKGLFGF